ncbi:MAG: hypothetical protein HYV09_06565 [Deltaproteobacteria bacterium]|nr:hypothetical protein [Deltaproteobacteria bacterium]
MPPLRAGVLLSVVALLGGCAPRSKGRPCRALPLPAPSVFERCGGMIYHAPPGSSTHYAIRFVDQVGGDLELVDLCVLLDEAPIFTRSEIDAWLPRAAKEPAAWTGKIANVRHSVQVQATYKVRGKATLDRVVLRAAQEVAPADDAVLELIAYDKGGSGKIEERLSIKGSLPGGTAQPRCE